MEYVANLEILKPDIVVFLDGDYSDFPEEMDETWLRPIIERRSGYGDRIEGYWEKWKKER